MADVSHPADATYSRTVNKLTRWLVPATIAAVLATGAAVNTAAAGRAPQVPATDVSGVLAALAASDVQAYSGTFVSRSDLGLPNLPASLTGQGGRHARSGTPTSAADPQALLMRLLSGQTTVRVWVDGPTKQRAQVLDQYDQIDLVRNGTDAWAYASSENAATHYTLPAHAASGERGVLDPAGQPSGTTGTATTPPTPAELAQRLLAAADPTTKVSLGTPQTVAGRAAWTVLMTPRTQRTLVAQASIAVDTKTGMPLRVQVVARGRQKDAVDVGFTSLSLDRPAAARFAFTPPPGAGVTQKTVTAPARHTEAMSGATSAAAARAKAGAAAKAGATADRPTVIGQGWTSVVELRGVDVSSASAALDAVTTRVAHGRVIRTALLTVLITDDGRVFVGAVPPATLQAAAR